MSDSVTIQVPARLHLGFLDMPGKGGQRFGSIGLPLEGISTELTITRANETIVSGDERDRILDHLNRLRPHLGIYEDHRITVHQTIPNHAGLGSGTQIALAVSAALRTLHGLPFDVREDATFLGRGTRSGIGIAAFEKGGVILDAGRGQDDQAPTVISRIPFPEDWRILLVFDAGVRGIHGSAEIEAFKTLPSFPAESSASICRAVLMGIMPALLEGDIQTFGKSLETVQHEIGTYFSPAQGGIFTSRAVENTLRQLADAGAVGIGQSSWGPTGFAFARSQLEAEAMVRSLETGHSGTVVKIARARNRGAEITHTKLAPRLELKHGRHH